MSLAITIGDCCHCQLHLTKTPHMRFSVHTYAKLNAKRSEIRYVATPSSLGFPKSFGFIARTMNPVSSRIQAAQLRFAPANLAKELRLVRGGGATRGARHCPVASGDALQCSSKLLGKASWQ